MKHGYGEFKWETGGVFKGNYAQDVKCGYGEMTWGDGSQYKGTWLNGIQNGLGIMSFSNGLKKAGIFKDNVLVEMLKTKDQILQSEFELGVLPAEFKLELN